MSEHEANGDKVVTLDGSLGVGDKCHLTLITTDPVSGTKEITYEIPYLLLDTKTLQTYLNINAIAGYRIEKFLSKDNPPMTFRIPGEIQ
jgi:hypothetical protein